MSLLWHIRVVSTHWSLRTPTANMIDLTIRVLVFHVFDQPLFPLLPCSSRRGSALLVIVNTAWMVYIWTTNLFHPRTLVSDRGFFIRWGTTQSFHVCWEATAGNIRQEGLSTMLAMSSPLTDHSNYHLPWMITPTFSERDMSKGYSSSFPV